MSSGEPSALAKSSPFHAVPDSGFSDQYNFCEPSPKTRKNESSAMAPVTPLGKSGSMISLRSVPVTIQPFTPSTTITSSPLDAMPTRPVLVVIAPQSTTVKSGAMR
jgi:hypothetical protein